MLDKVNTRALADVQLYLQLVLGGDQSKKEQEDEKNKQIIQAKYRESYQALDNKHKQTQEWVKFLLLV